MSGTPACGWCAVAALSALFCSCSLKYGMNVQDESSVPEFIFTSAGFDRYEDNSRTLHLEADRLEQYKDGRTMYAEGVEFRMFDKDGALTTEGRCGMLGSDTDEEKYVLYDAIEIRNEKDDLTVSADSLKWNGKSEQLTSGRNDMVSIKKGGTTIYGSGFSASGVSKRFAFTGVVTGEVETDAGKDEAAAESGGNSSAAGGNDAE
ncbi:MAG: LPS export ABC transporter periplasmic protein LptC [Treponemataceae bacterium]|nr:LPS export ABC transporter periplasmic protein LptC [Treponemataceae bacterium]